jgi:hypothetical protein
MSKQNLFFVIFEPNNSNKTMLSSYFTRFEAQKSFDLYVHELEIQNISGKVRLQHNNWCITHEIE